MIKGVDKLATIKCRTGINTFGKGNVVLPVLKLGAPSDEYSLDYGVAHYVNILREHGVETFESCQGGKGHCFSECTIRFHGTPAEGLRALSVAIDFGLPVMDLMRQWSMIDGEITGPYWFLIFKHSYKG